jgi:hypothetical protein
MYRAGPLKTEARKLPKYKVHLEEKEKLSIGLFVLVSQQMIVYFLYVTANANHHLGTSSFVYK